MLFIARDRRFDIFDRPVKQLAKGAVIGRAQCVDEQEQITVACVELL